MSGHKKKEIMMRKIICLDRASDKAGHKAAKKKDISFSDYIRRLIMADTLEVPKEEIK